MHFTFFNNLNFLFRNFESIKNYKQRYTITLKLFKYIRSVLNRRDNNVSYDYIIALGV